MIAKAISASPFGTDAVFVEIEAQLMSSLRRFSIVGLPDGVLREAKDRVRCAVENSGFSFPHSELIVSLAPATLPKYGSGFDLAIALCVLAAQGQVNKEALSEFLILGELSLNGQVKGVAGTLACADLLKNSKMNKLMVSLSNQAEASLISGNAVYAIETLGEAVLFLNGHLEIEPISGSSQDLNTSKVSNSPNFSDVVGQYQVKRALEVVAAGGHNLLMVGPPGSGKSMLAERLSSILPPLSEEDQIELMKIHSASNLYETPGVNAESSLTKYRPFRAPHHTASTIGIIGGGPYSRPGDASLAHKGVLFLDELPEFKRDTLEALRQPLETKSICISRARLRFRFPADFILLAAMNPCPCGYRGSNSKVCRCSIPIIRRYHAKLSGPLLDRIDLQLWVPPVNVEELTEKTEEDPTPNMKKHVTQAREIQAKRFKNTQQTNANMSTKELRVHCHLSKSCKQFIRTAQKHHSMSARAYTRVLKLARTIADLELEESLSVKHLAEAISYRFSDWNQEGTM